MQVAFTAIISEFGGADGVDREALLRFLRRVDRTAIDAVGVAGLAPGQDVAALASFILHSTVSLGVFLRHRIGAVAPTIAAQHLATLDQLSCGRVTVEFEPDRPGEGESVEDGFARVDEYLVLIKRLWSNERPIDHEGKFYRMTGAFTAAKPFNRPRVPLSLGGLSGTAIGTASRHADIFSLPAASLAETRLVIERLRAAAQSHRRAESIRFSCPVQPVLSAGARRIDGTTRLEGSPEAQALALLAYCDIGVTDFHVHGLADADQAETFANTIAPLVKRAAGRHDEHRAARRAAVLPHATLEFV